MDYTLTTPERVTADIRRLCRKIGASDEPAFVVVSPRPDSGIDDCFLNVERHVTENGGNIQHGWMIWEWQGISLEGIFHGVWRRPDGQMFDLTRKPDGEVRILFAADNKRVFAGRRVNTVRMAIGHDPRIKEWIDVNDRFDQIVSRQLRDVPFGTEVVIQGKAAELRNHSEELTLQLFQSRAARRARHD